MEAERPTNMKKTQWEGIPEAERKDFLNWVKSKNLRPTTAEQWRDAYGGYLASKIARDTELEEREGNANPSASKGEVVRATVVVPGTLTDAKKKLFDKLHDLNGLENYRPAEVPDEILKGNRRMVIPEYAWKKLTTDNKDSVGVTADTDEMDLLHIAALNAEKLKDLNHPHYVIVGILRALIVARKFRPRDRNMTLAEGATTGGIYTRQDEIVITKKAPRGWSDEAEFTDVAREVADAFTSAEVDDLKELATLLPVFAALQFQKTNHHYLSNDDQKIAYERHFKSCLIANLANTYNKPEIIYDSVHWLGPMNMEYWIQNAHRESRLPLGMEVKMNPTPAGTAVILTQLAVWDAIKVFPGAREIADIYATELDAMNIAASIIKSNRLSFHVYAQLFGKNNAIDDPNVQAGIKAATSVAAIAQAFIDALAKGTDLERARALKKHSDANIALYKIALSGFRGTMRRIQNEAVKKSLSEAIMPTIVETKKRDTDRLALPAPDADRIIQEVNEPNE